MTTTTRKGKEERMWRRPWSFTVHLDLTHGINYSSILTYRAVKEALEWSSIFASVEFAAYNSDPISWASDKLSVNVIEEGRPVPRPLGEGAGRGRVLEPRDLNPEERRKLFEEELACARDLNPSEISAFIGALYNGLPLALLRFYPEADELGKVVSKAIEVHEKYVSVGRADEKLIVERRVGFGKDFKAYIFAHLAASLLEKLGAVTSRESEVSISRIKGLASEPFKFDERLMSRIGNDVHSLEEKIGDEGPWGWRPLCEVLGRPRGEPDKRNFLAHSGLEWNLVEVRKGADGIEIRYDEEGIETVRKLCRSGLANIP